MNYPFPHNYSAAVSKLDNALAGLDDGSASRILAGAPVQFGGQKGYWSPETLLLASIGLCFLTTLESFAAKDKLEISAFVASARGTLDKTKAGLVFTKIELQVEAKTKSSDIENLKALIEKAKKYCIISNALKTEVLVSATVNPL